jgi:hypothetical protein
MGTAVAVRPWSVRREPAWRTLDTAALDSALHNLRTPVGDKLPAVISRLCSGAKTAN